MSDNAIMFCHDDITIFYPVGAGRVYAIAFRDLADAEGDDAAFDAVTEETDLAGMLIKQVGPHAVDCARLLAPLDPRALAPSAWRGLGFDDDLGDALETWADYCDRIVASADGEDAVVAAVANAA